MSAPLRVLMVEDSEDSALLLEEELRAAGCDPQAERVETAEQMRAALARQAWDVVLADFRLPRFSGSAALELLQQSGLDIPCIVVSGTVGEERAVELMHAGARDLVLKENLARLVPAVQREVREAEVRRERRQAARELELARQRMLEAEKEKKRFYQEIIRAVTHDRFVLVDPGQIPLDADCVENIPLNGPSAFAYLRKRLDEIAVECGMPPERATDLVLCVGEAATNAIKHAVEGRCQICVGKERIIVRVSDRGGGIRPENLPAMMSRAGFSTQASLGMGYTIMLELADRVWLATDAAGTVVQIEKLLQPKQDEPVILPATWERL